MPAIESYAELKRQLLNRFDEVASIARDVESSSVIDGDDTSKWIKGLTDAIKDEKAHLKIGAFRIVVCGEAKVGKSLLLNGLIRTIGLCPVDTPVTTNSLTEIAYADDERIYVEYYDQQAGSFQIKQERITRSQIAEWVTEDGNPHNTRHVVKLDIRINNPSLKDGRVLVDTPGLGSLNPDHSAVTAAEIPDADVVILAAKGPISDDDMLLAKRVARNFRPLVHVLTWRDTQSSWRETLRENHEKLALAFDDTEQLLHPSVAVSSKQMKTFLQENREDLLEASGFLHLDAALNVLLGSAEILSLTRAAIAIKTPCDELRQSLLQENEALDANPALREKIEQNQQDLRAHQARLTELLSDRSIWISNLHHLVVRFTARGQEHLRSQFDRVRQVLEDDYLQRPEILSAPERIKSYLTADLSEIASALPMWLVKEMTEICRTVDQITGLDLNASSISGRTVAAASLNAPRKFGILDGAAIIGRSIVSTSIGLGTSAALASGAVFGIIGTAIFPGVGTVLGAKLGLALGSLVGSAVGMIKGIQTGLGEGKRRQQESIRATVLPAVEKSQADYLQWLTFTATEADFQLQAVLIANIQKERRRYDQMIITTKAQLIPQKIREQAALKCYQG